MSPEIIDYVTKNRIGVLCVLLQDGSPHAATVHYSHQTDPLTLYVTTSRQSKKCEAITGGQGTKASFVIGFNEDEMRTIQFDGEVACIRESAELQAAQSIHYQKHPHAAKYKDDPDTVLLWFTPTWWRYSDYGNKPPRIIHGDTA